MILHVLTVTVSAFLLFQVQPMLGKIILPWFGGSAAVWTTCLLFFQAALVIGYLYGYWLLRQRARVQAGIHLAVMALSLLFLPIAPTAESKAAAFSHPAPAILGLLLVTVGLPYSVLSATSPLIQAWYARESGSAAKPPSPYRLYAASNLGSLLGLISYPVVVERYWSTRQQSSGWSWVYAAFVVLAALAAIRLFKTPTAGPYGNVDGDPSRRPVRRQYLFWVTLPACSSILLLAITSHLTQDVAPVPLLWVVPLAIYLVSLVICFERDSWYQRRFFLPLFGIALGAMSYALPKDLEPLVGVPLFVTGLFVCCMVCHGELVRLKPESDRLAAFYVMISMGGALGGVFVAVVAPLIFSGYFELPLGLVFCAAMILAVLRYYALDHLPETRRRVLVGGTLVLLALTLYHGRGIDEWMRGARLARRNFYGTVRVTESADHAVRVLLHGGITHGTQLLRPDLRKRPTTYYGLKSGVGLAIRAAQSSGTQRIGIIGLGAGTLAAYGRPGDHYRFYEINPLIIEIANSQFSFLRDSEATVEVVRGDARLSLEREPNQDFDILVIDAFSGDSVPTHLLTKEAFGLYDRHLKPDGVIAVNISNRYLDLRPVVKRGAESTGKEARLVHVVGERLDEADAFRIILGAGGGSAPLGELGRASDWVLVSAHREFFDTVPLLYAAASTSAPKNFTAWTDNNSNVFALLKR